MAKHCYMIILLFLVALTVTQGQGVQGLARGKNTLLYLV